MAKGCGSTAKTKLYLPIKKFGTYEMLVIVLQYIIKNIKKNNLNKKNKH